MQYKILLIKNRVKKTPNFNTGLDWFEEHTPLKMVMEEMSTDFQLDFVEVGNYTFKGGVPGNLHGKLSNLVPRNKYNAVVVISDDDDTKGLTRVSICYDQPLFQETELIYLCKTSDKGKTLNHELIHSIFKNLGRKGIYLNDPMDTYLRDNELAVDKGITNRTMALELLKPYWDKVVKPATIVDKVITAVTPTKVVPNEPKTVWKYFKPEEKTGTFGKVEDLKFELVTMLDAAREIAGVPFKITSGYRTPEHNKKVGGVKDSAHLTREAVDIACTSDQNRHKIINALIKVGFNRIGIANTFIHCDISKDKSNNVIWIYK